MATTATPTKTRGLDGQGGIGHVGQFTLVLDTTDASGLMTLDLTSYFSYVDSVSIVGSLAATGYVVEIQKPAKATALTATNLKLGFYEAAADGNPLDAVASTDLSAVITGLTIEVKGKKAIVSSWS
jgi:hypothetical protein